jgi:hypothetical protein
VVVVALVVVWVVAMAMLGTLAMVLNTLVGFGKEVVAVVGLFRISWFIRL